MFSKTNYGSGLFRLIDSKGYYDEIKVNLINPSYLVSSAFVAPAIPNWNIKYYYLRAVYFLLY